MDDAPRPPAAALSAQRSSYGRGARVLSVGIASTGLLTFAYFSVASYVLDDDALGGINLLWTVLFIAMSVFYRPVEQLLSRTIAATGVHPVRRAAGLQLGFAAAFLLLAFAFRDELERALRSDALFWVLVVAAAAYAGSYYARGWFAGQRMFAWYGGLVFFEAAARLCFPIAVAVGIASGETAVALGIAAAPIASLLVLPWAVRRRPAAAAGGVAGPTGPATPAPGTEVAATGGGFALAVAGVQLGEQALLNVAALLVPAGATVAVVFGAFLITRVPLQLFQSVQTSLLPHLSATSKEDPAFWKAIRTTLLAVAGFAAAVVLGLLLLGPTVMPVLLDVEEEWSGLGLAAIGLGMGFHLAAGTLTQVGLATGAAGRVAGCWIGAAALFAAWMALEPIADPLTRAEVGYVVAAGVLAAAVAASVGAGRAFRRA